VFVHGLFGHPQKTWTGHKLPEQNPSGEPNQSNASNRRSNQSEALFPTRRPLISTVRSDTALATTEETFSGHASSSMPETPITSCPSQAKSLILGLQTGEVFWPGDLLPTVLPETRIFTWGYDADIDAFSTSVGHNNVEEHANDLIGDIANLLDTLGDVS
jgi:hypothetical protein